MIQFRIQGTPNPRARKYIVGVPLKSEGKVSYREPEECGHVPLAKEILEIIGITQVHLFDNTLTLTQDGSIEWADLDQVIQDIVLQHAENHDPQFVEFLSQTSEEKEKKEGRAHGYLRRLLEVEVGRSYQCQGGRSFRRPEPDQLQLQP